jgi:hypothetical protein
MAGKRTVKKCNYLVVVNIQFVVTAFVVSGIRRVYEVMVRVNKPSIGVQITAYPEIPPVWNTCQRKMEYRRMG